jgi:uncharacterized protein (TIGR00661 family)
MVDNKINKTVLIAPLDWGLGHATRCIKIIHILLQNKCRVLIAADGPHKILLQEIFPQIEFLYLKGYRIKYANKNMLLNLAKQLPSFLKTIKIENKWLDKTIEEQGIDLIISDNRYGLWSKKIPSVFITHQLQLQVPFFLSWMKIFIRKRLYILINNFSFCWVPDVADKKNNLSGELGHPIKMPNVPVNYIGPLSRFVKSNSQTKKYTLMVCLSGPEPQRTLFETIILPQLRNINGQVILVRGKPGSKEILSAEKNVTIFNHLPTIQMQQAFEQSRFVLSRCGYSTLMDMQMLDCKCIFVPTPGQTEQEYLGKRLHDLGQAIVFKQAGFDLKKAIDAAEKFNYHTNTFKLKNTLENEIANLLK